MRDNSNDPSPYAVICNGDSIPGQPRCGSVFLTDAQYMHQLNRPDNVWFCPHCGSTAEWDDDCQATNPPETDTGTDVELAENV